MLADAFFPKNGYRPPALFAKIVDLIDELPTRPRSARPNQAPVWVMNEQGKVAVSCPVCFRTFPVSNARQGQNEAECDFCSSVVRFEIIAEHVPVPELLEASMQ